MEREARENAGVAAAPAGENKLLDDVISSPAEFARIITSKFPRIDVDGNNTLSLYELEKFEQTTKEPKEKAAVAELSKHFEDYRDLATAHGGGTLDSFFAPKEGTFFYNRVLGSDSRSGNTISGRDINSLDLISSTDKISDFLADLRSSEIKNGIAALGAGALIAGLGGALIKTAPGPIKLIGLGMTALGVAAFGHGVSELAFSNVPALSREIQNRRQMLTNYGFKLD